MQILQEKSINCIEKSVEITDKSANSIKNCNFYIKSVILGKLPILHRKVCKIKKKLKCLHSNKYITCFYSK